MPSSINCILKSTQWKTKPFLSRTFIRIDVYLILKRILQNWLALALKSKAVCWLICGEMDTFFNLQIGLFVVSTFQTYYCNNWIQMVIFHTCSLMIQSHQQWFNWPTKMGNLLSLKYSACHSKTHSHLSGCSDTPQQLHFGNLKYHFKLNSKHLLYPVLQETIKLSLK